MPLVSETFISSLCSLELWCCTPGARPSVRYIIVFGVTNYFGAVSLNVMRTSRMSCKGKTCCFYWGWGFF